MADPTPPDQHDEETLASSPDAGRPAATVESSEHAPARIPEQIGHYRIKRIIAAGGMGVVYEAIQEHPRRTVALKIVKQGIASRSALRRFEYESQILARLRHPGIAQIYEAGMHDDGSGGVPFFAMEYIAAAKDLIDYARSKDLPTRKRLELFDKVCDAVHHGHQKGIIHRDLKPANILVDTSGQPKIIDFGVARATDSDLAMPTLQTDVGQLVGTVQYMSPEQIEADPHDIDTRSDVYALGVVLYKLLTDTLPYDVSGTVIYEATRMVREQQPKKLGTIRRELRGDIETIVTHALEKDRDRRYQSCIELASDIRRYLASRPIQARPPSITYTFRTFVKRNKVVVAAIAAVFVALVSGIVGTTWQKRRADEQRTVAVAQRDRAERMFGQVKELAHTFMWDFHDAIHQLDGSMPARELMVTTALKYLDGLTEEAPDSPELMIEVALAYDRVGDILGGFRNPSLGNTEGALENYHRAMEIRRELSARSPDDDSLRNGVAASHIRIGDILKNTGDISGAFKEYDQALAIRETLPETEDYQRVLSFVLNSAGKVLVQMGKLEDARLYYDRSLAISKKLAAGAPTDDHLQRELSVAYGRVADVFNERGDHKAALRRFREMLRIRQAVLEKNPDSGRYRRDVAVAHLFIGQAYRHLQQPQDALEHLVHFRDVSQQRAEANPNNWRTKRDLAASCEYVARAQISMGNLAAATGSLDTCQSIIVPLSQENPDQTVLQGHLADSFEARGLLAMAGNDPSVAVEHFGEAMRILDRLVAGDPENFQFKAAFARLLLSLGTALAASGDHDEAQDRLETARELFEPMFAAQPEYSSLREGLAGTFNELARLTVALSGGRGGRRYAQQAFDLLRDQDRPSAETLRRKVQGTLDSYANPEIP